MAMTEAGLLAAISATDAKIAQLISAIGAPGDYRDGDFQTNRATVIVALQKRRDALQQQLDELPDHMISTFDLALDRDDVDGDTSGEEYVEEPKG